VRDFPQLINTTVAREDKIRLNDAGAVSTQMASLVTLMISIFVQQALMLYNSVD
jgi:hypothetical protein